MAEATQVTLATYVVSEDSESEVASLTGVKIETKATRSLMRQKRGEAIVEAM